MKDYCPSPHALCLMLGESSQPPLRELYMRRVHYRLPNFKQTRSHNVQSVGSMAPVDRQIEREQSRILRAAMLPAEQRWIVCAAEAHWNGGNDEDRVRAVGTLLLELRGEHKRRHETLDDLESDLSAAEFDGERERVMELSRAAEKPRAELWRCNANRLPAIAAAVVLEIISGHGWSEAERRKAIGVTHKGSSRNWSMPYLWALERWIGIYRAGLDAVRGG